ncbi:MAG: tol-pal system protein YbgF [Pseudomonadota bacterium]|nr:tol-pal system protein YbgF [Pseudomonadota bacterium]
MIVSRLTRIVLFAVLMVGPATAMAQGYGDMAAVDNRLTRLETELQTISRMVARGGEGSVTAPVQYGASATDFEVRLTRLEAELQVLTGQLERQGYDVKRVANRLDKAMADIEFRLRAVEGGVSPIADTRALPSATGEVFMRPDPLEAAPLPGSSNAGMSGQIVNPALLGEKPLQAPGTLGTIASSDLVGEPRTRSLMPVDEPAAEAVPALYAPVELPPREAYDAAFELLRQAAYDEAEAAFSAFLIAHPDHELSPNAQYWLGETYYVRDQFKKAAATFAEGYQKYPDGPKAMDNLLKLGMALSALGQKDDACLMYDELVKKFPTRPLTINQRMQSERQKLGCP